MNWCLEWFDAAAIGAAFAQFLAEIRHPQFWAALTKIIWINVLLSGDNALVVALACRALEPRQRFWGMILGAAAAVVLRIIFTAIVATVMGQPYLKLAGGLALIVIAAKLLVPDSGEEGEVKSASHLLAAVQIVVVADIVMSLDNVIAVAAAANGSLPLLVFGLASSIPLIVAGAALIMAILARLPILIWAGAGLLGWLAGDAMATDPAIRPKLLSFFDGAAGIELDSLLALFGVAPLFAAEGDGAELVCAAAGVVVVLLAGSIWRRRRLQRAAQASA